MRLLLLGLGAFCSFALAEVSQPVPPQQPNGYPAPVQAPPKGTNTLQVFDNDFFNSKQEGAAPLMKDRYAGPDSGLNSEQDAQCRQSCDGEISKGMKDFRDCYGACKKKVIDGLKQSFDEVERRQQMPITNVPAPVQDFKRPPAYEE